MKNNPSVKLVLAAFILTCIPLWLAAGNLSEPVFTEETDVRFTDGRFYCAVAADVNGDGVREIIAVGQKDQPEKKAHMGYIAMYRQKNGKLELIAEESFPVEAEGPVQLGRCRIVKVLFHKPSGKWYAFASGKAGTDEAGIGFLRQWVLEKNSLKGMTTLTFKHPEGAYTHGYPLELADIDGDGIQEIVYGGFYGEKDIDFADIRVFKMETSGKLDPAHQNPFEALKTPFRVNALETVDMDGDGVDEIIMAGRSNDGTIEKAAFAWWNKGKMVSKILEMEVPSRFRTLLAADLKGDGKPVLVSGGRMDVKKVFVARMTGWQFSGDDAKPLGTYHWTFDGGTRLRTLADVGEPGVFLAGGRSQLNNEKNKLRWQGFVAAYSFKDGRIMPTGDMIFLKKGRETRVRYLEKLEGNRYVASGFIMDKEKRNTGFISIIKYR